MFITKEGSLDRYADNIRIKNSKPKTFYCYMCGCEFVADRNEYRFILHKLGTYSCCPCCGTNARQQYEYDY
jgi:hypothetical protein